MKSKAIRDLFFSYFEKNGHHRVPSSSLVPHDDPTLLFTNAGMNQFKGAFLGYEKRSYTRAVTAQKCVRAGGKHNDLENVGFTARHHTFFEMMGNFSFGDYFKKDAIHMAWDLLTRELEIPKDKLFVTVFQDDDEAADIWHKQEGVPRDRILRFGEKDNFWRMGDVGPCGPCSEIFYDHGPEADLDPSKPSVRGGEGDRYVEIWNNVFMQFNEDSSGRHPLPKPSVDTGAGLERWAAMLQGRPNNYDTDLFTPILARIALVTRKDYVSDYNKLHKFPDLMATTSAMRVIADHARSTSFLIADGVLPSNEGRGYVLRRIMRRAIRYGRKLSDDSSLLLQAVQTVIDEMSPMYPELSRRRSIIENSIQEETQRFLSTLDQGTSILMDEVNKLKSRGQGVLSGTAVFKLYDTYGFPVDLTRLMAMEQNIEIDEKGFETAMNTARSLARQNSGARFKSSEAAQHLNQWVSELKRATGPTRFVGYSELASEGSVLGLSDGSSNVSCLKQGQTGLVILDQTPFYGESGGQVGDKGELIGKGPIRCAVFDTTRQDDLIIHHIEVLEGELTTGLKLQAQTETRLRTKTARNHSATHLLHAALRTVLGEHVTQAGSSVEPERLRFDFSHNKPLTRAEIEAVEQLVNTQIDRALPVSVDEMSHADALKRGALALFGEKYGERVRVIFMGDASTELCGGTHVGNTAEIRALKILSETGVSAGVRRILAVTGSTAIEQLFEARTILDQLKEKSGSSDLIESFDHLKLRVRELERELKATKSNAVDVEQLISQAIRLEVRATSQSIQWLGVKIEIDDRDVLAKLADRLRDKLGDDSVVALIGVGPDGTSGSKHPIVVTAAKAAVGGPIHAGRLLGKLAGTMGGRGGGRPDFAQGAGDKWELAGSALVQALQALKDGVL